MNAKTLSRTALADIKTGGVTLLKYVCEFFSLIKLCKLLLSEWQYYYVKYCSVQILLYFAKIFLHIENQLKSSYIFIANSCQL